MKKLFAMTAMASAMALVGCGGGGDIKLSPTNIDNSVDNSVNNGGGANNACASYVENGQTFQGEQVGDDCFYDSQFVSSVNPITSDVTFERIAGNHVFENSLFIGEDVDAQAAAAGTRIPQEGEGAKMTVESGVTMVFEARDSYLRVARGSQIFAEGTADAPIIFTADEDVEGNADENDRGLWGGIQINGNGMTNKCHDGTTTGSGTGNVSDFDATANNVHNCNQTAEGRPATYGGNNNAENSGSLRYVVIKHAGFEVVDGNELNALTLNAVGSGTTISHVQTYTTQDDGFEMFGGAVNLDHIVAVNVGDDSIDYSEGYQGKIQYAVVLHTSGSNRCIEGDNTGENRSDDFTPRTMLQISNMTCITSDVDEDAGTNPTSKGSSEGPLFREGAYFEMYNSLITSNEPSMNSNECLELDDSEGPETIDGAQDGTSKASSNVIACGEALKIGADGANTGFDLQVWLDGGDGSAQTPNNTNVNNVVITGGDLPANVIVNGVGTRDYRTAASIQDGSNVEVFDQANDLTDVSAIDAYFEAPTYLGGATASDDWLDGWTVGFDLPLNP